jgi:hypothetical protein
VVPKGYSKASCHDFKVATSKASEVMAAEARGETNMWRIRDCRKICRNEFYYLVPAETLSVVPEHVPEKQLAPKKKDGAWTGSNKVYD